MEVVLAISIEHVGSVLRCFWPHYSMAPEGGREMDVG